MDKRGIENFKDGWRLGFAHGAASVSLSTHGEPPAGWPEWRDGYRAGWAAGKAGDDLAVIRDAAVRAQLP